MTDGAKWQVRLSAAAETDFQNIVRWTSEHFGEGQAHAYADTLSLAIEALTDGPRIIGAKERDEIAEGRIGIQCRADFLHQGIGGGIAGRRHPPRRRVRSPRRGCNRRRRNRPTPCPALRDCRPGARSDRPPGYVRAPPCCARPWRWARSQGES
ncbi:MAG TPA: type II toxin-antitoxin system RelE/ParE family toxin [Rhodospirillaceae bacterium]|nr:type II toxin-antitoxin system RelE/ParE family toxin [Rhodospirillaceae bacterium]